VFTPDRDGARQAGFQQCVGLPQNSRMSAKILSAELLDKLARVYARAAVQAFLAEIGKPEKGPSVTGEPVHYEEDPNTRGTSRQCRHKNP